jgi:predicted DNA-binding transcriptional regulator YafY
MKTANPILVDAITGRRRISFVYNEKRRIVEPQCYGIGSKGTELLRAHQLEGGTEREPLFDVSKIQEFETLDTFSKPGPNYKRNDSAMKIIFAQL